MDSKEKNNQNKEFKNLKFLSSKQEDIVNQIATLQKSLRHTESKLSTLEASLQSIEETQKQIIG